MLIVRKGSPDIPSHSAQREASFFNGFLTTAYAGVRLCQRLEVAELFLDDSSKEPPKNKRAISP